ncbi:sigma-70 family RNA polymerase sigma factor [Aporhodopirellula aestuarii]|uniref:Sigma-70 family RNA polymerase sigma factor n=1 Tax=Aporhodopirellula aestuarii TaxID=2950107 RepID=A0ABT0U6Q6_9BACT|nr:sigma-70 family RNA polymerase sigma factor [Aporhodopirellula aestuarii]MCM2372642.1 sigma-70 family RNA polymerase sigma factor [Aporhodopirellula aestuarii]
MSSDDNVSEKAVDLTVLWVKAEPNLRAFVAATVWDVHHAEDVLQEIASVVSMNFASYDPARPFLPWSLGIARLKVLEYLRSCGRDRVVLSDATLLNLESAVQSLSEEDLANRRAALQGCVKRLAGRQRRVIELRYIKEKPLEEIARELATTRSTVAVTLHRARTALRECINRSLDVEGTAS